MATGTPLRMATRSIRSALTQEPFWLFRSTSTYPAASGLSSRDDLVGILEHDVVLRAAADLQQTITELHEPVKPLLPKDHEPGHGSVTSPGRTGHAPSCAR
jgi:hypothetical protein